MNFAETVKYTYEWYSKSKNLPNDLSIKRASFSESLNISDLSCLKELLIFFWLPFPLHVSYTHLRAHETLR